MSIVTCSVNIFSNSYWILLVTILVFVHPETLGAAIPDLDSNINNFLVTGISELNPDLKSGFSDSISDYDEFNRLLRDANENDQTSTNRLPLIDEIPESLKIFLHFSDVGPMDLGYALKKEEKIQQEILTKSSNLPERFTYVAKQFYLSWKKPSDTKNFERKNSEDSINVNDPNNFFQDNNSENEEYDNTTKKPFGGLWRNIITAPIGGCPPGQRKDSNGRCRRMIW